MNPDPITAEFGFRFYVSSDQNSHLESRLWISGSDQDPDLAYSDLESMNPNPNFNYSSLPPMDLNLGSRYSYLEKKLSVFTDTESGFVYSNPGGFVEFGSIKY